MAEEQEAVAPVEGEPQVQKKLSIGKLLLFVILLGVLGGGGYFAYMKFVVEAQKAEQTEAEGQRQEGETKEEDLGLMFSMEPFLVNLAGTKGKRFLKVTVSLEMNAPEVRLEVQENLQKITDSILILLSSKTFEDVYSVQGKFKLKDEVTTRVNRFLLLGHIKDVYFTEFVIQ